MAEAAVATVKKSPPTILPDKFGLVEHKRRDFIADVKPDVKPDDIMDPAFWAHVAEQLNPLDTIEVRWEDGSLIRHLRVLQTGRAYAKVHLTGEEKLDKFDPELPEKTENHKIEWKGPTLMWCVIRLRDSEPVSTRNKSRQLAAIQLAELER